MTTYSYAHEKFATAVSLLATEAGPIRARIYLATQEAARAPLEGLPVPAYEIFSAMRKSWRSDLDGVTGVAHFLDTLTEVELVSEARKLLRLEYLTRRQRYRPMATDVGSAHEVVAQALVGGSSTIVVMQGAESFGGDPFGESVDVTPSALPPE